MAGGTRGVSTSFGRARACSISQGKGSEDPGSAASDLLIKHRESVPSGCLHCAAISIKSSRALPFQAAWVGRTKSRSTPIQLPSGPLGQEDSAWGLGDITELPHQPGRGPLQLACTFWGQFSPFPIIPGPASPLCAAACAHEQGLSRAPGGCFYPTSRRSPQAGPKDAPRANSPKPRESHTIAPHCGAAPRSHPLPGDLLLHGWSHSHQDTHQMSLAWQGQGQGQGQGGCGGSAGAAQCPQGPLPGGRAQGAAHGGADVGTPPLSRSTQIPGISVLVLCSSSSAPPHCPSSEGQGRK